VSLYVHGCRGPGPIASPKCLSRKPVQFAGTCLESFSFSRIARTGVPHMTALIYQPRREYKSRHVVLYVIATIYGTHVNHATR
jgi:hypothetical protein